MDELDLEPIRARAAAATPGPWRWHGGRLYPAGPSMDILGCRVGDEPNEGDAAFIAGARTDVEVLIAEVVLLRSRDRGALQ